MNCDEFNVNQSFTFMLTFGSPEANEIASIFGKYFGKNM